MSSIKYQTDVSGARLYSEESGRAFPSTTTVIRKFEPNRFRIWKENVGEEVAAQITKSAARIGTRVHKLNETFLSKPEIYTEAVIGFSEEEIYRHNLYKHFLELVTPIFIEKKFIHSYENETGFGGTPDLVGIVENAKMKAHLGIEIETENECSVIVADYKNWTKPKYKSNLIGYYLQLAAYSFLSKSSLPSGLELKSAYILGTAKDKGQLYIYSLDSEKLNWYYYWFKQMVDCYFSGEKFDWMTFEAASKKDYLAERLKYVRFPEGVVEEQ